MEPPKNSEGTELLNTISKRPKRVEEVTAYTIHRYNMGFWLWALRPPPRKSQTVTGKPDSYLLAASTQQGSQGKEHHHL